MPPRAAYGRKRSRPPGFAGTNRNYKRAKVTHFRRKQYHRGRLAVPRGLRPSVHYFTRSFEKPLALDDPTAYPLGFTATTDGGVAGTIQISASELNDWTDFSNLFGQYKLNAVSIKILPQYTAALSEPSGLGGEQIVVRWCRNMLQKSIGAGDTRTMWLDRQAVKQRLLMTNNRRTLSLYSKLNIRDMITDNTAPASDDFVAIRPHWIATANDTVPHYGLNVRFDSCSGVTLPTNPNPTTLPKLTLQIKYYLMCRMVV